ncbi:WD domain, G-beta repeat protein [Ostertagia ostertagi]
MIYIVDPKVLSERLRGHRDAIWSIAYHSSDNRLVSASSDGTVRLWEPGNFGEPLLRSLDAPSAGLIPTSVDFVSTEPSQLLTAYTSSTATITDIETGATILSFDFGEDDVSPGSCITRILSHPTMPLTITAGDDRKIRYFDNHTGISSLAIDPNGLYLLSGSHDGSLRMWNMEKRVCLQEISAHRKKYDASVTCVAFHPSRPLIGSAGADSLAKVYCPASS